MDSRVQDTGRGKTAFGPYFGGPSRLDKHTGANCTPHTAEMKEQLRAMAPGTPVELRLHNDSKLRGWIGDVSESGLTLRRENQGKLEVQAFRFEEIDSAKTVRSVEPTHIGRKILIGIGVTIGSLLIIGILISDK
jgi:hypothetical protein